MRKYGYLVVEGPHDIEFVYRLLSPFGMKRVTNESELDIFFSPLIPRQYPPKGDLQKRMPTPLFLQNETHSIAIHSATGDSNLVNTIEETVSVPTITLSSMVGIGIFLDADSDEKTTVHKRYSAIQQALLTKSPQFKLHDDSGKVKQGKPNWGAFVLPDNASKGTLEDLLLECADLVYPDLLELAKNYVDAAKMTNLNETELKEIKKPAGKNKAVVGVMANIMKPGKSVQVSIQDNNWLEEKALSMPRIKSVQEFLQTLFEL